MKLLQKFKARQRDMKTLSAVIESSLARSSASGEALAGAHQLALSACEMQDGLAEQVLVGLGKSGDDFAVALHGLESETLRALGLEGDAPGSNQAPVPRARLGKTDATFEAAIKATYELHNENGDYTPLTSAHLLAGVATVEKGVAARVFASMGLDRNDVIAACRAAS